MTTMRAVWIVCDEDRCDSQHPLDMSCETVQEAERQAKADGWRCLRGGVHRCPSHCPVCGATEPSQQCATASGRDHLSRRRQEIARV